MDYKFNNFYELITFQAKKRGKKVALFVDDEKITYADILEAVDKLAAFLADKGVKKGDKNTPNLPKNRVIHQIS